MPVEVCQKCNFDFKEHWLVPHRLLRLKFHRSQRTPMNVARTVFWHFVPTLVCMAICMRLSWREGPLVTVATFVLITIPVTIFFTVLPILAFLKHDHLRDVIDEPREDNGDESLH